jgi:hypothetical protein
MCRNNVIQLVSLFALFGLVAAAHAGTAYMDFDEGVGLLTLPLSGTGVLSASEGRASYSGAGITYLSVTSEHPEISMTLRPQTDAVNRVGLHVGAPGGIGSIGYSILVSSDGTVTAFDDWHGVIGTASFADPSAPDCRITWSNDGDPSGIWVLLNDVPSIDLSPYPIIALWMLGVEAEGPASFEDFTAQGAGIPDYPSGLPSTRKGYIKSSSSGWVQAGMSVTLSAPDGSDWQWYKDGAPILGANDNVILLEPVEQTDSGTYEVAYYEGAKARVASYPYHLEVFPEGSLPLDYRPFVFILLGAGILLVKGVSQQPGAGFGR